jgi:hypothetical protein
MSLEKELEGLKKILRGDLDRAVFLTAHQLITRRIFDQGKDSKDRAIGEYSEPYVKRRAKAGRGSSKKVILEWTGQMRNDFHLIEQGGKFGSGFLNDFNADKSEWVESTYKKDIFEASKKEEKDIEIIYQKEVNRILNVN